MTQTPDRRHVQVGIDRLVRLEWLSKTALLVAAGNDSATIKSILQQEIKDSFRSGNPDVRGSLDKTITILMRVWLNVPGQLESLRLDGLKLLTSQPHSEHLCVHWGMIMAVYPFWMNVATQVGRLLKLQDAITPAQVQRRVREQYGERETVARRARYVLRSFIDWGLLTEGNPKGAYRSCSPTLINNSAAVGWMVEACLHAKANGGSIVRDLIDGPWFFPFQIKTVTGQDLSGMSPRLEFHRDTYRDDLVMLKGPI
jgi:hypothetical protein